jgi:hypothetical protein
MDSAAEERDRSDVMPVGESIPVEVCLLDHDAPLACELGIRRDEGVEEAALRWLCDKGRSILSTAESGPAGEPAD